MYLYIYLNIQIYVSRYLYAKYLVEFEVNVEQRAPPSRSPSQKMPVHRVLVWSGSSAVRTAPFGSSPSDRRISVSDVHGSAAVVITVMFLEYLRPLANDRMYFKKTTCSLIILRYPGDVKLLAASCTRTSYTIKESVVSGPKPIHLRTFNVTNLTDSIQSMLHALKDGPGSLVMCLALRMDLGSQQGWSKCCQVIIYHVLACSLVF